MNFMQYALLMSVAKNAVTEHLRLLLIEIGYMFVRLCRQQIYSIILEPVDIINAQWILVYFFILAALCQTFFIPSELLSWFTLLN